MSHERSLDTRDPNWRARAMLAGGIIGSLLGTVAAYLYVRASEETSETGSPRQLGTREAIRVGTALVAVIRQIADLGSR